MGGIVEAGGVLLAQASRRLENSAMNLSSVLTPGYKARIGMRSSGLQFESLVSGDAAVIDWRQGEARSTSNPLDVSIAGDALFVLRGAGGVLYSRNGQFHRGEDGTLLDGNGMAVQSAGGDIVLNGDAPEILTDGTILDRGEPVARIQLVAPEHWSKMERKGGYFSADAADMHVVEHAVVRQGFVEASNVNMATEVLAMMQSQRSAENGQMLVRLYDDLMGRALTAFGQSGS